MYKQICIDQLVDSWTTFHNLNVIISKFSMFSSFKFHICLFETKSSESNVQSAKNLLWPNFTLPKLCFISPCQNFSPFYSGKTCSVLLCQNFSPFHPAKTFLRFTLPKLCSVSLCQNYAPFLCAKLCSACRTNMYELCWRIVAVLNILWLQDRETGEESVHRWRRYS